MCNSLVQKALFSDFSTLIIFLTRLVVLWVCAKWIDEHCIAWKNVSQIITNKNTKLFPASVSAIQLSIQ